MKTKWKTKHCVVGYPLIQHSFLRLLPSCLTCQQQSFMAISSPKIFVYKIGSYIDLYIHTNTHHININATTIAIANAMSNAVRLFSSMFIHDHIKYILFYLKDSISYSVLYWFFTRLKFKPRCQLLLYFISL